MIVHFSPDFSPANIEEGKKLQPKELTVPAANDSCNLETQFPGGCSEMTNQGKEGL